MRKSCLGGLVAGLCWLPPFVHSIVTVTIRVPAGVCNDGPSLPSFSGTATAITGSIPGKSLASPPPIAPSSVSTSAGGTGTDSSSLIPTSSVSIGTYTVSSTATQTIVITLVSVASSPLSDIQAGSVPISDLSSSGMLTTSDNVYSSIESSSISALNPLLSGLGSSNLPTTSIAIGTPYSATAPLVSSIFLASSSPNGVLTSTLTTSHGSSSSSSRTQISNSVSTAFTSSSVASSSSSNQNGISTSAALFSITPSIYSSISNQTSSSLSSVVYSSSSSVTSTISTGSISSAVPSRSSTISQTGSSSSSSSLSSGTSNIPTSLMPSVKTPSLLSAIALTIITTTTTFTTTTITPGAGFSSSSLINASNTSTPTSASSFYAAASSLINASNTSTPPSASSFYAAASSSAAAASSSLAAASTYVASSTYALKLSDPTPLVSNCGNPGVDESQYGITLPFTMNLFDQSGTDLTITTNGLFSIASEQSTYIADVDNSIPPPVGLPSYEINPPAAFVWWEYLQCTATYPQGIYYQFNDSGKEVSIEWLLEDANGLVYQFIANYDANYAGTINFYYFSSGDGGANATVGVEGYNNDQGQVIAVQYEAGLAKSVYPGLLLQINTISSGYYNTSSFNTSCIPAGSFPGGKGC